MDKNMDLSKFKVYGKPEHSNQNITFIVEDAVGEYELPKMDKVTIHCIHSGNQVEEVFRDWKPDKSTMVIDPRVKEVFQNRLQQWKNPKNVNLYNLCEMSGEEYSDYYQITFWKDPNWGLEHSIEKYLDVLHSYILAQWNSRGADDDYYDYLPSLTDMFRQLAEILQVPEKYNNLVSCIMAQEGTTSDDWDDPLYVQELKV